MEARRSLGGLFFAAILNADIKYRGIPTQGNHCWTIVCEGEGHSLTRHLIRKRAVEV